MSKALYAAQAWPPPNINQEKLIHTTVVKLYKAMQGKSQDQWEQHDDDLSTGMGLLKPHEYIAVQRLRYAKRLLSNAPPLLLALLQSDASARPGASWVDMLHGDFHWMWEHLPRDDGSPKPEDLRE